MIEKEFNSIDELLTYFWKALEGAEKKEKETKNNNVKVNYESSQEDLIKRLREQNKKYFSENTNLTREVELLSKRLKEAITKQEELTKENASLKGGPYNKDFYTSVMSNLGKKIIDEYVLWLNLCKALKLEDTEMWDAINDDMYDKIPE